MSKFISSLEKGKEVAGISETMIILIATRGEDAFFGFSFCIDGLLHAFYKKCFKIIYTRI